MAAGGATPPSREQEEEEEEAEGFEVVLEPTAERITWIDLEAELDDDEQQQQQQQQQQQPPTGAAPKKRRWRPQHAPQRGRWRGEGHLHSVECYVRQGEVLYLPALWCVVVCGVWGW